MGYRKFRKSGYRRPKYNIPVNIIEETTHFEAWVYCLSFKKEEVKIWVNENTLYITGQRTPEEDQPNFLLQEYPIKSFERIFELSHRADQSKIVARFEDGILKIKVPKLNEVEPDMQEVKIQ
ncbi:MAG: Hsp20/alpha crystallin family protein [Bacteroidota bacterium]